MTAKKLLIATSNKGKLCELKELLSKTSLTIVTTDEININLDFQETGDDIFSIAKGKAISAWRKSNLPSLSEDTALEVDILSGLPGPKASRFFGVKISDKEKQLALLNLLKDIPLERRTARFRCAMAVAFSEEQIIISEGVLEGIIAIQPQGESGFGYDPVFLLPQLGKTLAQLALEEKNAISHRAQAVRKLLPELLKRLL